MGSINQEKLINQAMEARKNAYVPYSDFPVGAAVLTDKGKIYTGCNVENASYGLSNCAERTAIFKAVSEEGDIQLKALAVVAKANISCVPCGACRQVMAEFSADDFEVIMANLSGDILVKGMEELLWGAFNEEVFE